MIIKTILGTSALLAAVSVTGCANKASTHPSVSIENSDSVPATVKKLVRSVAESDTAAFADLMSYPVVRPYPLPDVDDRARMESYYPIMVDDSLRRVISSSTPADWHEFGWRGWSIADGQYLWLDDTSVYSINYLSHKEHLMKDSLASLEIASLSPELRKEEWAPVACLKQTDGDAVFRIDLKKGKLNGPAYRLLQYASRADMRKTPLKIYTGYMETQGTAMIAGYHFTASDGSKAEYMADLSDDSSPAIDITSPDGKSQSIEVKPAYWLQLLPAK